MAHSMEELTRVLGEEADLPPAFERAAEIRETINVVEMVNCYETYKRRGRDSLSDIMRGAMDKGRVIPDQDYRAALDGRGILNKVLDPILSRCDAILCPAALGPAPWGLRFDGERHL